MAMMTLKEFVRSSLTDILKGIIEAQGDEKVGEFVSTRIPRIDRNFTHLGRRF